MAKQSKPVLFIGTLFSSVVKKSDAFERKLDDKITSLDDLKTDAQINLNKWLATLPGRLLYTIQIQKDPFDENGIKQVGMWVTMTLLARSIGGKTAPLDTILLAPVDPLVYYPTPQETQTVQFELPKLLKAEEIAEVQFPEGEIRVVDKSGTTISGIFPQTKIEAPTPPAVAPATVAAPAPAAAVSPPSAPVAPPQAAPFGFSAPVIPPQPPAPVVEPPAPAGVQFPSVLVPGMTFKVARTGGQGLNLRDQPSIAGRIITSMPFGSQFVFENRAGFKDGFTWYAGRSLVANQSGFAAAEFLETT